MMEAKIILTICFFLMLHVEFSLQCKRTYHIHDNKQVAEQERLRREQELKQWCHEHCVTEWSPWSSCDSRCGRGQITRTRTWTDYPMCRGKIPGCRKSIRQTADCNAKCPFGGIPSANSCSGCPHGRKGTCCETEIFCAYPQNPQNGKVTGNWPAKPNAVAQFACNIGFNLIGNDVAVCSMNGSWSTSSPKCEIVQCVQPIQNPHVKILNQKPLGYAFGEKVYYDCEDGYTMEGERIRTCQRSVTGTGEWTGYDVQCKPVACPQPEIPLNGGISNFSFTYHFKDSAHFECSKGYKLVGTGTLQCLASGNWYGHEPQCEEISCEPPFSPRNGQVRIRKAGVQEYAVFECDEGYRLDPSFSTLFCTAEGTWNGTEPKCVAASCGDPGFPKHGYRDGGVFTFGNKVTFHCEAGYEMKGGSKTMECQSNAQWSGILPTCKACPVDYYMEDGKCEMCPSHSYTVSNASTSVVQCLCDQDKGFVGPPGGPCEELFCMKLKAPENGNISKCGNRIGDSCEFYCDDGFVVERGSTVRTCQNTGYWDGTQPFCVPCQLNTYKSGERTCAACPLHSHTEQPGQMLDGCVCDDGFQGPPGGPCIDVDECIVNNGKGPCSDTCENNDGGYKCRCSIPGYKINPKNDLSCIPEKQCLNLTRDDAPENGGLVCHWFYEENSQHCASKCNPGYEMPSRTNDYETCGPATGYIWSFQVLDISAALAPCIPEFFPGFRLEGEWAYFAAACEDLTEKQKNDAKQEFAKRLNDKGVCTKKETKLCDIKDMAVICGRTTRRRKRRGVDVLEHSVDFAFNVSAIKFEDKTTDCHGKICPMLRIPDAYCDQYCIPTYKRYLKAAVQFAKQQLTDIQNGPNKTRELGFDVDSLRFTPEDDGFRASDVIKECPSGMVAIDDQCVPCMAGSYLDEDLNECMKCPPNYFQDKERQYSCISCKDYFGAGFSTSGNGSATCMLCLEGRWGEECVNHCDCAHGSCSPFDGQCICPSGWEGPRCEKDIDSCVPGSCYPGVTCVDEPPPGAGFSCGPCPTGYYGDGIDCTPLLNPQNQTFTIMGF